MKKTNKNRGVTLIELAIVMAISGILSYSAYKFFQDTFDVWKGTRDSTEIYSAGRTAMDEMSRYIRQASTGPVTVGGSNESVQFTISKSTEDWGSSNRVIKYFQPDSQDILRRYMKGSTTTLVSGGVDMFYVWYDSGTASRYAYVGSTLTLSSGDERANLSKKIFIRSSRGN